MSIFGEAIGKLLCCTRLGTIEYHDVPPLERTRNPSEMVITHLVNAWRKNILSNTKEMLGIRSCGLRPRGNQESVLVRGFHAGSAVENSRLSS